MTRTQITAADGTHFVKVGRARLIIARTIGGVALVFTAIFLSAAIIGVNNAVHDAPAGEKVADYNDGWTDALGDIIDRAQTPAGAAKIESCIKGSHTGDELHTCLDDDTIRVASAR